MTIIQFKSLTFKWIFFPCVKHTYGHHIYCQYERKSKTLKKCLKKNIYTNSKKKVKHKIRWLFAQKINVNIPKVIWITPILTKLKKENLMLMSWQTNGIIEEGKEMVVHWRHCKNKTNIIRRSVETTIFS